MTKSTVSHYFATMRKNGMLEIESARNIILAKHKPMQEIVNADKLYRVQVGAFRIRENAEAMVRKIKEAGFEAFVTETEA